MQITKLRAVATFAGALLLSGCGTTGTTPSSAGPAASTEASSGAVTSSGPALTVGSGTSDPGGRSLPVGGIVGAVPVETDPLDGYRTAVPVAPESTWTVPQVLPHEQPLPDMTAPPPGVQPAPPAHGLGAPPIPAPPGPVEAWPTR